MADVYDFVTGRLCKRCELCRYWKDLEDFNSGPGKYSKSDICAKCEGKSPLPKDISHEPEDLIA